MGEVRGFDQTKWLQQAASVENDLTQLTKDLTEAQFHAPSRSGGWSIGYCIEHLILTGQAYLTQWDSALARAGEAGLEIAAAGHIYPWWQRELLHFMEVPSRIRLRAPAQSVPFARRSIEQTTVAFLKMHREMTRRVTATRGLDVRRVKVRSPFQRWIRLPLGLSFDLVLAHERRHLAQARAVGRQLPGVHSV